MDERPTHISSRCGDASTSAKCAPPPFHAKGSSPFPRLHQQQLTAPVGGGALPSCATANSDYGASYRVRALPQEMQGAGLCFESIVPSRQPHAATQIRYRTPFGARSSLELIFPSLLLAICFLPIVSCIKEHTLFRQAEIGAAAEADQLSPADAGDIEKKLSALLESQLSQVKNQQRLEALAMPFAASYSEPSPVVENAVQAPSEAEGQFTEPSMVDLGSPLPRGEAGNSIAGSTDIFQLTQVGGDFSADTEKPFSFLNWGQVGGLMQSPALAHTGMGVQMPRQVVGTTVGLDFDSPATFHGPLLVALMVCTLIFFVVLMLCCWMVKSKRKHDKFMAEKLPR